MFEVGRADLSKLLSFQNELIVQKLKNCDVAENFLVSVSMFKHRILPVRLVIVVHFYCLTMQTKTFQLVLRTPFLIP